MAIAALLLGLAVQAADPVRVEAHLSEYQIEVGQTVTLRVDVVTSGARAQIQPLSSLPPGLEVIGTRDWDQRQFSLPGGIRRYMSREFTLRANAPGRYQIPAATAIVDAQTYSAAPSLLEVLPGRGGPSPMGEDDVILRAWTDLDTVYVGQQLTLNVEAMFSRDARLRLRRAPEYEAPAPSGFWVHDIPDPRGVRPGRGEVYETQLFRRAFFPISPGRHEIPPARLFYEMRRGILHAPETFTVASRPLPIRVLPVPEDGRPPYFTGAVGRFSMTSRLEPDHVAAGDAVILTVEVTGVGNIKALPPPRLPDLPGVEVFPPSEDSDVSLDGGVLQGRKRFAWVLIPRAAGRIEMGELEYAYFEPERQRFETATAPRLALTVEPGAAPAAAADLVRYIRPTPSHRPLTWVASPGFLAAQAVPLLLFASALLVGRRRGAARRPGARALRRRREALIAGLETEATADAAAFLAAAPTAARSWLADRLGLDTDATLDAGAMAAAGVDPVTASATHDLLTRLESARFAPDPPGPAERMAAVRRLAVFLRRIDDAAPRPAEGPARRRRSAGAAATACLACLAAAGSPGVAVAQEPDAPFDQGVRFYDLGRYADAAEAFRRHAAVRPGDASGWYNLGTAAYRAGQRGHAIHAWLRAVHLDPRDRDARHNLRAAGVPPETVRRVSPPVPLRAQEMTLLASLLWFVAGAIAAAWALRRRRGLLASASAAAAVALALALGSVLSTRGEETLIMLEPAPLRAGPNLQAEAIATLDAGAGLVPVDHQGAWVRARTRAGQEGWVESPQTGRVRTP
jgi:tetratricopeptide (TPR) repeat protein